MTQIRAPAVQGLFYARQKKELEKQVKEFFQGLELKADSQAIIAPHAGFIYSGRIAAQAFARLKKAKTYVIIAPNHTGYGSPVSVYSKGHWQNCLGQVQVNDQLAQKLMAKIPAAVFDETAHLQEHSIEVMLPFLQHLFSGFQILPIVVSLLDLSQAKKLAQALFELSQAEDLALIASSDFTHFQPLESAKAKDLEAIDLIKALKLEEFDALVKEKRLSICGFQPIEILMHYCSLSGLRAGELLDYGSSAESTGDQSNVVGYAALAFT